jgi:methionine aminotransferase
VTISDRPPPLVGAPAVPPASKLPKVGTTIFTVMSQLATEVGAVNLGQGFPDFPVPEYLVGSAVQAMREGKNQYAPMAGVPALREAIADITLARFGTRPDPDTEITVTSGASEAIFDAVLATVRSGDEVIVLDPCYDLYEPAVELAGGVCVHVPLRAHDFGVDWALLAAAVSPRTRMIVVNSPNNPTGAVWTADDVERLATLTRDTGILVLSDEVYEHIVFDGRRHESVLRHAELASRSFVVSSFGKTYHCTGWRTGYCIAPRALTAELRKVHQYNTFSSFAPAQWAFAGMMRAHPEHHQELSAFYEAKRDGFVRQLERTRLRPLAVEGGYFQIVDYSAVSDLPDAEFARWLCIEHGVATIPLSPFYGRAPEGQRLVRLCFAKNQETLDAAIARLELA